MNRILVILAITVAVSLARTIPSNSQRSSVLKQKHLAALLDQLSRERQVYQHVKRECLRMGPLGCLDGMFNQLVISITMYYGHFQIQENTGLRYTILARDAQTLVMTAAHQVNI